jgi:hypothetical protein
VANLNGRPDLVIANAGSNDVSILLNVATPDGGFTLVPGPRLQAGVGPTSTAVTNVAGDPFPDLLISDGGSNQVRLLRGVGGGFFADQDPTIYYVGSDPVQVMAGSFLPDQGPEILTVNRGSNNVTVISNFTSKNLVVATFPTGGTEPVAAFGVSFPGQSLESLVVANEGDGVFTLLGGAVGLGVVLTETRPSLPEPTALDFGFVSGNAVWFYATTAGEEAAFTLEFILPELSPSGTSTPSSVNVATEAPAQLEALSESSLTLLVTVLNTPLSPPLPAATESPAVTGSPAAVNTSFLSVAPSQGQSLYAQLKTHEYGEDETEESTPATPVAQGPTAPPWVQSILGVGEAFQEIRRENRDGLLDDGALAVTGESPRDDVEDPLGLDLPAIPAQGTGPPAPRPSPIPRVNPSASEGLPDVARDTIAAVDQALDTLGPIAVPPISRQPAAAVPAWVPVAIASPLIVRANRPGKPERRAREPHP